MSVHLTVNYQSGPAAAKTPAANPAADKDQHTGPLGFLAALVDNLTQRSSDKADKADADTKADADKAETASTDPALRAKLYSDVNEPAPTPSQLLDALTATLADLEQAKANGEPVDPDLLKKLAGLAEALANMFAALPAAPAQADPGAETDPALATAPASGLTPDSPAALLAQKLEQLSAALAKQSPDLAAKFETFAKQLAAANTDAGVDADVLAKLNLAAAALKGAAQADMAKSDAAKSDATKTIETKSPLLSAAIDLKLPSIALAPRTSTSSQAADAAAADTAATPGDAKPATSNGLKVAIEAIQTGKPDDTAKSDNGIGKLVSETATDGQVASTNPVNTGGVPPVQLGAAARALPVPYAAPAVQANIPQVAFQMVQQFHLGQSRFQIRLDPPELGRVDVRMHVDNSGNVHARLTVERTETLDMFQRDQRSLEKALAQAGLDSSKTNLEFSLKQNPSGQNSGNGQDGQPLFADFGNARIPSAEDTSVPVVNLYRGMASAGGVNLFV